MGGFQSHSTITQTPYHKITLLHEIKNTLGTNIKITTLSGIPIFDLHLYSIVTPLNICIQRIDSKYCVRYFKIKNALETEVGIVGELSNKQDFVLVLRTTGMTPQAVQKFICCCYFYIGNRMFDLELEGIYVINKSPT